MVEFADRRPRRQLLNLTRKSDILTHMVEFHFDPPSGHALAPDVQRAHRDSHSAGQVRMPHEHTLPNHVDGGAPTPHNEPVVHEHPTEVEYTLPDLERNPDVVAQIKASQADPSRRRARTQ